MWGGGAPPRRACVSVDLRSSAAAAAAAGDLISPGGSETKARAKATASALALRWYARAGSRRRIRKTRAQPLKR